MAPYTIEDVQRLPKKMHPALGYELPFDGEDFRAVIEDPILGPVVCCVNNGGGYYRLSGLPSAVFRPAYEDAQHRAREHTYVPPSLWRQLCSLLSDSFLR